jgi:hypothetical protein
LRAGVSQEFINEIVLAVLVGLTALAVAGDFRDFASETGA